MQTELPKRKPIRLKHYDYSQPGYYFITICTEDKTQILSKIPNTVPDTTKILRKNTVGDAAHGVPLPNPQLTPAGQIVHHIYKK